MKLEMKVQRYPGETGEFLRVDESRCTGCGACARFCTRGVWQKNGASYRPVDIERCVECGACWNACPADAVIFDEPRGGTGVRFLFG
ncbi:MAG TPA: ferredoxin family protein [Spirochaetia bacterium]